MPENSIRDAWLLPNHPWPPSVPSTPAMLMPSGAANITGSTPVSAVLFVEPAWPTSRRNHSSSTTAGSMLSQSGAPSTWKVIGFGKFDNACRTFDELRTTITRPRNVFPFRISEAVTADEAVIDGFDFDQCCTVQPTPWTPNRFWPIPGGNTDCESPVSLFV